MRSPTPLEKREAIVSYGLKFIGQPYEWGGDGKKFLGFDCSGLTLELLWSIGAIPKGDRTAQEIYDYFKSKNNRMLSEGYGNLLFFGKDLNSITHIGLSVNPFQYIEAGGGDRKNLGGMVRLRPTSYRSDLIAVIDFIGA